MFRLVVVACILWFLWNRYGHVVAMQQTQRNYAAAYPLIAGYMKHFPTDHQKIRATLDTFLDAYEASFHAKWTGGGVMKQAARDIERHVHEVLFSMPNDLAAEVAIEEDLAGLMEVLGNMIRDAEERHNFLDKA